VVQDTSPKHSSRSRHIGNSDIGARGFFFLALVGSIVRQVPATFCRRRHHPPDGRRPSRTLPTKLARLDHRLGLFYWVYQHPLIASPNPISLERVRPVRATTLGSKTPV